MSPLASEFESESVGSESSSSVGMPSVGSKASESPARFLDIDPVVSDSEILDYTSAFRYVSTSSTSSGKRRKLIAQVKQCDTQVNHSAAAADSEFDEEADVKFGDDELVAIVSRNRIPDYEFYGLRYDARPAPVNQLEATYREAQRELDRAITILRNAQPCFIFGAKGTYNYTARQMVDWDYERIKKSRRAAVLSECEPLLAEARDMLKRKDNRTSEHDMGHILELIRVAAGKGHLPARFLHQALQEPDKGRGILTTRIAFVMAYLACDWPSYLPIIGEMDLTLMPWVLPASKR